MVQGPHTCRGVSPLNRMPMPRLAVHWTLRAVDQNTGESKKQVESTSQASGPFA